MRLLSTFLIAVFALSAQKPPQPTPINIAVANIEGVTLDALTGQPLAGVTIVLNRVAGPNNTGQPVPPQHTTSTADGHFVLEDVLAGGFRLFANRQGYVSTEYGAAAPGSPGKLVELKDEQDIQNIDFRLLPESVISGRVLDEEGKPIRSATVQALRLRYQSGRRQFVAAGAGITTARGEYRITGLAPGRYYIFARPLPGNVKLAGQAHSNEAHTNESYIPAFYPAEEDQLGAGPVDVATAIQLGRIDITLRRGEVTHIRGRAIDSISRKPISGATISVVPADGSDLSIHLRQSALSNDDGTFDVPKVRPGSYVVTADSFVGELRYSDSEEVSARNPSEELVLRLAPAATLTGSMRLDGPDAGSQAAGGQIELQNPTDTVLGHLQAKVDQEGTFELKNVVPGRFSIGASGLNKGYYVKAIKYGDRELSSSLLTVPPGVVLPLQVLIATSDATASGVVLDGDGNAVPGALVALVPDDAHRDYDFLYRTATTDDAGKFSMPGIAPGQYTLLAWRRAEDAGFRDPAAVKAAEKYSVSVDLKTSKAASIDLRLVPPGS